MSLLKAINNQINDSSERVAIVSKDRSVSYSQLDFESDQLSNYLKSIGVCSNAVLGVLLPKSVDFITSLVAILKRKSCYLPIDTSFPIERIKSIILESGMSVILTNRESFLELKKYKELSYIKFVVCKDIIKSKAPQVSADDLATPNPNDKIYIIYTSGSTGKPKGAINCYKGFENLLQWYIQEFNITSDHGHLMNDSLISQ